MSLMLVLVDGPSAARGPERRAVVRLTSSHTGWRLSLKWIETGRTILRYVGDEPRLMTESFLLWCSMNEIDWVADQEGADPNRVIAGAPALLRLYPPAQVRAVAERLLENLPPPQPADEDPRVALRPKLDAPAPQARPLQVVPQQVRTPAPQPAPAPPVQTEPANEEEVAFDRFLIQIARARKAGMSRDQALMAMHAFSDEALGEEYVEEEEEVEEVEEEFEEDVTPEPPLTMTMAPGAVATVALATPALLRPARPEELPPELAGLRDPRAEAKMRRTMERAAEASQTAQAGAAAAGRRGQVAVVTEEVIQKRSLEETLAEAEAGVAAVKLLKRQYEATNPNQAVEAPIEREEAPEEASAAPAKKRKRAKKD